jgi:hypothetical protein
MAWLDPQPYAPTAPADTAGTTLAGTTPLATHTASVATISTGPPPSYEKMHALGELVSLKLQDDREAIQSCSQYVRQEHTTEWYTIGRKTLRTFNKCMESREVSGALHQAYPPPVPLHRTRWTNYKPAMSFRRLFRILCEKVSKCQVDKKQHHRAMLRLNGFQPEDDPLTFDMFLFPCKRSKKDCQQCRFIPDARSVREVGGFSLSV